MGLAEIERLNDEILEAYLAHTGVAHDENPPGRGSGRYAYGSGENPGQHQPLTLAKQVSEMKAKGLRTEDIYKGLGYKSSAELRMAISIESDNRKKRLSIEVPKLKNDGLSIKEISNRLGYSQTTIRNYLDTEREINYSKTKQIADMLKDELKTKRYIDFGPGVEIDTHIGSFSREKLKTAIKMLEDEGYKVHKVKVEQLGNPGQFTTISVLGEPDTEWKDVKNNPTLIQPLTATYNATTEKTSLGILPVKSIDSSRVFIRYTDQNGKGGAEQDGLIELRRGVEDISLGPSTYSQVRIGVDGDKYMKGMAIYSDDIPDGYDVVYNTNKKVGTPVDKVYKPMKTLKEVIDGKEVDTGKIDEANPFGASIKPFEQGGQSYCLDQNGNPTKELRVINKVTDQGDWQDWGKTISPQMLSKQPLPLVTRQLDATYKDKEAEFNEIMNLTNPVVKKNLLDSFADDCDASAVHLKAKAFSGQGSFSIIPVPTLKGGTEQYRREHGVDGEVYAPRYEDGTTVALVRYPHGGTFEIPILRVNNKNPLAKKRLGNAPDAIGINAAVAERLSGADFDGDTVTVIPTTHTNIKSTPRLRELVGFDTKVYKFEDENAPGIKPQTKQTEMGKVTNLIADMQIKGAPESDVARAVKHSMVVIDSEKHHLDWKRSEKDNDIQQLKEKYQNGGGASTLITRANSEVYQDKTKPVSVILGPDGKVYPSKDPATGKKVEIPGGKSFYGVNPLTGEKVYTTTGTTHKKKSPTKADPNRWIEVPDTEKVKRMERETDARNLMSSRDNPNEIELAYANHANKLKSLASQARLAKLGTPNLKRDPQAAKKYADEVKSLTSKVIRAEKNAPLERQATIISSYEYKMRLNSNPSLKNDKDKCKKLRGQCLQAARYRLGAKKKPVDITDREWEAIQNGAVTETLLSKVLQNANADRVKQLATPRSDVVVSPTMIQRIKSKASNSRNSISEIAQDLGISTTTVSNVLSGKIKA